MKAVASSCILALVFTAASVQASPSENPASVGDHANRAVYEVRVERSSAPTDFRMDEPTSAEQALEVSQLENRFRGYAGTETVRATYRFLKSKSATLVERAAYIGSSPAYGHYVAVKAGQVVSIVCVAHNSVPGAIISSSNCADAVGAELGAEYQALVDEGHRNDG